MEARPLKKIDNEKLMEALGLAIVIVGVLVYLAYK
jgi:hypothetical protein